MVPVGIGLPLPPLTLTETLRGCMATMLDEAGKTATVGEARPVTDTVIGAEAAGL
jgi:hypothetical protein